VAAVFRGELAASFAKVGHRPITLDAVRHDEASCAVFAVLPVWMRRGAGVKGYESA
jgi:hypothetical protein